MTFLALMSRALCAALALASFAGCELMKKNEEVTTVINRRAIGMPAGEFFDRFGPHGRKRELNDGSAEYDWVSSVPYTRPGPAGQDERICRLKVSVDIDNVVALSEELGVYRRLLYKWRKQLEPAEPDGIAVPDTREFTLTKEICQLKRLLGEKVQEIDFFRGALQKVAARRQSSTQPGETASTTRSGS